MSRSFWWLVAPVALLAFWAVTETGCSRSTNPSPAPPDARAPATSASNAEEDAPADRASVVVRRPSKSTEPALGNQWAVIVGINNYDNPPEPAPADSETPPWKTLRFAVNDARELRDMLRDEFGFARERISYLEDKQATRAAITKAVTDWLPKNVKSDDAVLFYFAGHGLQKSTESNPNAEGFLVPCDAQGDPSNGRYLSVGWLVDGLLALKCRHHAVILDSCYSGALFNAPRKDVALKPGEVARSGWDFYLGQPAFLGLTAAHDTPAGDGSREIGHSPFTAALLALMHDRLNLSTSTVEAPNRRWPRGTFGFTSLAHRVEEVVRDTAKQLPRWGALQGSTGEGDFLFRPTVDRLTPREKENRQSYAATIRGASDQLRSDVDEADRQLSGCDQQLRGWEWNYLRNSCRLNELDRKVYPRRVVGIGFSTMGQTIAVCDESGEIDLWDANGQRPARTVIGSFSLQKMHGLALDAAGSRLAVAYDRKLRLIELKKDGDLRLLDEVLDWSDPALLVFSGNGRRLAAIGKDGQVRLWDVEQKQRLGMTPKINAARALALSHDGQWLAVATGSQVLLWHETDGKSQTLRPEDPARLCCLAFAPDGGRLVAVDRQAAVFAWQLPEIKAAPALRHTLDPDQLPLTQAALSNDLKQVAMVREDRQIEIRQLDDVEGQGSIVRLPGHGCSITQIAFSPDGHRLATGDEGSASKKYSEGIFKIWETAAAGTDVVYPKDTAAIEHLAINNEQWIASADRSGAIHLRHWDPANNKTQTRPVIAGHDCEIHALDFNPAGSELASGSVDGLIRIWDAETGKKLAEYIPDEEAPAGVTSLRFDLAGQRIVAGYIDKNIRIWDVRRHEQSAPSNPTFVYGDRGETPHFHTHAVCGVTFFDEGAAVFSAGQRTESMSRLPSSAEWIAWRAADGEEKFRFDTATDLGRYGVSWREPRAYAGRVASSPDGRWLAAAGPGLFFTVWDAQHGRLMVQAAPGDVDENKKHYATDVAFSPDGQRLAVSSTDGVVRIWDPAGEAMLLELKDLGGQTFTVAFSPDGSQLVTASAEAIRVYAGPEPRRAAPAATQP